MSICDLYQPRPGVPDCEQCGQLSSKHQYIAGRPEMPLGQLPRLPNPAWVGRSNPHGDTA